MSIGDGFNIWMGKFLWDCFEVGMIILGVVAFFVAKGIVEWRQDTRKMKEGGKNESK